MTTGDRRAHARPDYREIVSVAEARRLVRETLSPARGRPGAGVGPGTGRTAAVPPTTRTETVPRDEAAGRVLAEAVVSAEDVPGFDRSTVDGYAVLAADTFGASESAPVLLFLAGSVAMGRPAGFSVAPGQAGAVPTGGMLPAGADAVVMVEQTSTPGEGLVEVLKPVAPNENVVRAGEDVARGAEVLAAGRRLTAADLGVLAATGVREVVCRARPRVAIIPTGDEVVPAATRDLGPGQVRDITSSCLAALVGRDGGIPTVFGVVPDEDGALARVLSSAVEGSGPGAAGSPGSAPGGRRGGEQAFDVVLILGGSSVGARDRTAEAIDRLGPPGVLLHGLAVKPGKPTIFGLCGSRRVPVFGLPGHPVSSLVVYRVLVRLALRLAGGEVVPEWEDGGDGVIIRYDEQARKVVGLTIIGVGRRLEEYMRNKL
ncbi:MAG: molybdopterin molybdenumtransferase MoeA [Firmicutes bacterium]|nr:molybdopterin molybdenumtransferase MoeA [Bacillota bacterium]